MKLYFKISKYEIGFKISAGRRKLFCLFTCFATETAGQLPEAQKEGLRALAMYEGVLCVIELLKTDKRFRI